MYISIYIYIYMHIHIHVCGRIDDWGRHIFRELNGHADSLANRHMNTKWFDGTQPRFDSYRLFFDGSLMKHAAGGGWVLHVTSFDSRDVPEMLELMASLSFAMPPNAMATVCELDACIWGVVFVASFMKGPDAANSKLTEWKTLDVSTHRVLQLAQLLE